MKLNSDVTKITSKDPGVNTVKDKLSAKQRESSASALQKNTATQINDPMFNRAKKILDDSPIVDKTRVREIKEKIRNGEYNIEPDKIADKLLRESIFERRFIDTES